VGVNAHEYIRTAIYLGVIAVVLRHRRWVKPARENLVYCIARGRNTCDSIDYNKWILQTTTIRLFKKGQLRSVLSILHEHTNYNYQRRCYEYCNQTYFLFLNDIEKNTIFTHNPANAKGVSNYDIVEKATCLLTHHRKVVRISLLRMTCVTFLIKEYRSRTLFK
jgi:hypothetical protein